MKPIGPYVAARELPTGTNDSAVRTLRATDRLTGVPVLLHVLPYALSLPELPEHPHLLPFVDSGMDAENAYLVTELPLQAVPATDATLAARGALAALGALHERGLSHGGVSAAQLWSVDGRVVLAGAGLPWHDSPSPDGDLQALMGTLDEIGLFPAALRPLRESIEGWNARTALALLDGAGGAPAPASALADQPTDADGVPRERPAPEGNSSQDSSAVTPAGAPESHAGSAPQHDGTPIVLGLTKPEASESPVSAQPVSTQPAEKAGQGDGSEMAAPAQTAPLAQIAVPPAATSAEQDAEQTTLIVRPSPATRPGAPDAAPAPTTEASDLLEGRLEKSPAAAKGDPTNEAPAPAQSSNIQPTNTQPSDTQATNIQASDPAKAPDSPPSQPGRAPVSPFSTAPAGAIETPQDRRRRQNEERRAQAMLDSQAAASRRAEQLRADAAARQAEAGAIPPPIQIGFPAGSGMAVSSGLGSEELGSAGLDAAPAPRIVIGEDDLPDWTPPEPRQEGAEQDGTDEDGAAENLSGRGLLKMRDVQRLPESLRRPAEPEPAPEPAPLPLGRLPSRHVAGGPIRIGWDEDDSWRVVKTVPDAPAPASGRPPRWLLPVLIAALVLAGMIWMIRAVGSRAAAPAPATAVCCDVAFTLRGAAGATAQLRVESAPAGANLTPGQKLGLAPGRVRFPVQGTYRLRVVAEGYESAALSLTVPRAQPVSIDLGS